MGVIEQVIRPFAEQDVSPTGFVQPGTTGVPPVLVKIGLKGGGKSFSGKITYSRNTKMGANHAEAPTTSTRIDQACTNSATKNDALANGPH